MPSIAADIIFMWPGTNSSIPTGWSRETTLDDRFTKGTAASTAPNVTGGGATHGHGTSSHASGTLTGHTHSGTTADSSGTRSIFPYYGYTNRIDAGPHTHTYLSASQTASGGDSGTSNWNSGSSEPSFFDMIYIKSNGSPSGVPPDAVAYWNTSSVPAGWIQHSASRDRFIMGPGSGGNGGGTGGGSHTHSANGSHTHGGTTAAHQHGDDAEGTSGGVNATTTTGTDNNGAHGIHKHRHTFDNSGAASISAATGNSSGSQSYEPTFTTLVAIENDGGSALTTQYIIGMWLGGLGDIPTGWLLCDGVTSPTPDLRNKFIKCANATSDVTTTGGSAGHTHSAGSGHTHSAGHTHTQTTVAFAAQAVAESSGITRTLTLFGHGHSTTTTSSSGSTVSTTTPISNQADSQPAFRTVAYIMLDVLASASMAVPAVHRAMVAAGFI